MVNFGGFEGQDSGEGEFGGFLTSCTVTVSAGVAEETPFRERK